MKITPLYWEANLDQSFSKLSLVQDHKYGISSENPTH